jgi:hypothetical protein
VTTALAPAPFPQGASTEEAASGGSLDREVLVWQLTNLDLNISEWVEFHVARGVERGLVLSAIRAAASGGHHGSQHWYVGSAPIDADFAAFARATKLPAGFAKQLHERELPAELRLALLAKERRKSVVSVGFPLLPLADRRTLAQTMHPSTFETLLGESDRVVRAIAVIRSIETGALKLARELRLRKPLEPLDEDTTGRLVGALLSVVSEWGVSFPEWLVPALSEDQLQRLLEGMLEAQAARGPRPPARRSRHSGELIAAVWVRTGPRVELTQLADGDNSAVGTALSEVISQRPSRELVTRLVAEDSPASGLVVDQLVELGEHDLPGLWKVQTRGSYLRRPDSLRSWLWAETSALNPTQLGIYASLLASWEGTYGELLDTVRQLSDSPA